MLSRYADDSAKRNEQRKWGDSDVEREGREDAFQQRGRCTIANYSTNPQLRSLLRQIVLLRWPIALTLPDEGDPFVSHFSRLLRVCVLTHIFARRGDLVNTVDYYSDPINNYAKWIRQFTAIWNNPGLVIIKYLWRILIIYIALSVD